MKRVICLICLLLLIGGGVFAQFIDKVPATVNLTKTEVVTVKQFELRLNAVENQPQGKVTLSDAEKKLILQTMIDEKLLFQAANKDKEKK